MKRAVRYAVHIDYRGFGVASSPFKTLVESIQREGSASTMDGPGSIGGIVNVQTMLVIQDRHDGTIVSRFVLNAITSYTLQVKTTFAGIHIAGSPKVLLGMIDDGITVPVKTFVVGTGVGPKIVVGESVKFTICC